MSAPILLPANYFPAVSYFHVIHQSNTGIMIEKHEHYPKQTYRNRTRIATANGILNLTLPIQHGRKEHVKIKDVRISYDHEWQRLHWSSIQTAYRSSAYFEYYEDDFVVFFEKKEKFLLDYNMAQLELLFKILKINVSVSFTDHYEKEPGGLVDYRAVIHPKLDSVYQNPKPYYQVFEERHGFMADMSIMDLIFNQGPQSKSFL